MKKIIVVVFLLTSVNLVFAGNSNNDKLKYNLAKELNEFFIKEIYQNPNNSDDLDLYFPNYPAFNNFILSIVTDPSDYNMMKHCWLQDQREWMELGTGAYVIYTLKARGTREFLGIEYVLEFGEYMSEDFWGELKIIIYDEVVATYKWNLRKSDILR
jgi:hypothetical protein